MNAQRVPLNLLRASAQPRPLQTADVDKLAASIAEIGLIQPVTVREVSGTHNGLVQRVFQIVAGHHRVAAARALGWTEIDAVVVQADSQLEAELIEIDENLCRSELSAAQRSHYIARRAEIREALAPSAPTEWQEDEGEGDSVGGNEIPTNDGLRSDGRKKGPQHHKAFAAETSALTGESKRNINQYRAIGDALGEDALRVTGTTLDKKVELMALAKLPEPERKGLIERAVAGEAVTARVAPTEAPTGNDHISPEATTLVQQARAQMQKALDALPSDGQPATLTHLHKATGPVMRASTLIRRANALQKINA